MYSKPSCIPISQHIRLSIPQIREFSRIENHLELKGQEFVRKSGRAEEAVGRVGGVSDVRGVLAVRGVNSVPTAWTGVLVAYAGRGRDQVVLDNSNKLEKAQRPEQSYHVD